MMQVLAKWKVDIRFEHDLSNKVDSTITLYISDSSIANVLRKVGEIGFSADGFKEPISISINLVLPNQNQASLYSSLQTVAYKATPLNSLN